MKASSSLKQKKYISRIEELYCRIEEWLQGTRLNVRGGQSEVNEEVPGRYMVPTLTILDEKGKTIAQLQPVGAWLIGAEGRVDILGALDRDTLVYMQKGGPQVSTRTSIAGTSQKLDEQSRPLFKGIAEAGWYWIEDKRRGRARLLNAQLFMDLVSEVSDYGV